MYSKYTSTLIPPPPKAHPLLCPIPSYVHLCLIVLRSLFGFFNSLLVRPRLAGFAGEEVKGILNLERSLEVTFGLLAPNVNANFIGE